MSKENVEYRTLDEVIIEHFHDNPQEISQFIETIIEEQEKEPDEYVLLSSLRNVIDAQGGLSELAHKTGIAETELETALSEHGMKALKHFRQILEAFGYTLAFKPVEQMQAEQEETKAVREG